MRASALRSESDRATDYLMYKLSAHTHTYLIIIIANRCLRPVPGCPVRSTPSKLALESSVELPCDTRQGFTRYLQSGSFAKALPNSEVFSQCQPCQSCQGLVGTYLKVLVGRHASLGSVLCTCCLAAIIVNRLKSTRSERRSRRRPGSIDPAPGVMASHVAGVPAQRARPSARSSAS